MSKNNYEFYDLKWDTDYFGVKSAKAILNKTLEISEWEELNKNFDNYQFVSITNLNSDSKNSEIIGKNTDAFLVDINIQFAKNVYDNKSINKGINIRDCIDYNAGILKIADFNNSKFINDEGLKKRGGSEVYRYWLKNSFGKEDKYFAISRDNRIVNGFILFSFSNEDCIIELIAVDDRSKGLGIGTAMFNVMEKFAFDQGSKYIKVGTQVKNVNAINFYHKLGFKQIECHETYHLWRK